MEKDAKYRHEYTAFMQDVIAKGYAERVPDKQRSSNDGKQLYIPYHGVYHPQKPEKIRVVFGVSAMFSSEYLNKHLL